MLSYRRWKEELELKEEGDVYRPPVADRKYGIALYTLAFDRLPAAGTLIYIDVGLIDGNTVWYTIELETPAGERIETTVTLDGIAAVWELPSLQRDRIAMRRYNSRYDNDLYMAAVGDDYERGCALQNLAIALCGSPCAQIAVQIAPPLEMSWPAVQFLMLFV